MTSAEKHDYDEMVGVDIQVVTDCRATTGVLRPDKNGGVIYNILHETSEAQIISVQLPLDPQPGREIAIHFGNSGNRVVWLPSKAQTRLLVQILQGALDRLEKADVGT